MRRGIVLSTFLLVALVTGPGCLSTDTFTEVTGKQRQAILSKMLDPSVYDPSISPEFEEEYPTKIYIQLLIQNVYSVSESDMDFSIDVFFRQKWMDHRLKFRGNFSTDWLELDNKLMQRVWVPDTYFVNEKKATAHVVTVPNRMMHVYQNGTVVYSMRLSLTLSCSMTLQKYPMDEQTCPIMVESYAYTTDNIMYDWFETDKVTLLNDVEMPQFEARVLENFGECPRNYAGQFACQAAFIKLTRKVGYYIVQVFVPSILIVVLSWLSFWVDHDAVPARISLGVLTVLTMTTQSAGARQSLPHVSYVKAIDIWMSTCLLFVFVALIEYAYVNMISRRRHVYVREPSNRALSKSFKRELDAQELVSTKILARRIDKLSRVLFPVLFFLFNIVFWLTYLVLV